MSATQRLARGTGTSNEQVMRDKGKHEVLPITRDRGAPTCGEEIISSSDARPV